MTDPHPFGVHARKARMQARVSLIDLARQLGWTPVYISDIEQGNRNPPRLEKAREWAVALGADPDEFARLAMTPCQQLAYAISDGADAIWTDADDEREVQVWLTCRIVRLAREMIGQADD